MLSANGANEEIRLKVIVAMLEEFPSLKVKVKSYLEKQTSGRIKKV